ncbi:MAG: hypothetical protein DLM59_13060 [Pseudonocardiales bacterium]|nr:MAG: hypothetical protein DLM59_13060 [Pseudonocardiales bacterium]
MRRFVRSNGLTLAFFGLFLAALFGESLTGLASFNQQQVVDGADTISYAHYLVSSAFAVDVAENWQSEYLQFFLYILGTIWLVQVGSPESKKPDQMGRESDKEQKVGRYAEPDSPRLAKVGGFPGWVYARSLGMLMGLLFVLSLLAQSVAGTAANNAERIRQLQLPQSWLGYTESPDFWNRTLQNWQSEFPAVASMVVFSIYLRERGSPESKPVGAPHSATGVEG